MMQLIANLSPNRFALLGLGGVLLLVLLLLSDIAASTRPNPQLAVTGELRVHLEDPQTEELIHQLQAEDEWQRIAAARELGKRRSIDAVPALIQTLDDPSDCVRSWAASALGKIGDPKAVPPLISAMERHYGAPFAGPLDHIYSRRRGVADFGIALRRLTGQRYGTDPDEWKRWFQGVKDQ